MDPDAEEEVCEEPEEEPEDLLILEDAEEEVEYLPDEEVELEEGEEPPKAPSPSNLEGPWLEP